MEVKGASRRRRWVTALLLVVVAIVVLVSVSAITAALMAPNGEGARFVDVATPALADADAQSEGACWGDIDRDGDLDLFVANADGPSRLYRNDGDGRFSEVGQAAGVSDIPRASSCAFLDLDQDGALDLFVGAKNNMPAGRPPQNRLFRNRGDGTFADVTSTAGLEMPGLLVASSDWADYNGDGDYDGFVAVRFGGGSRRNRPFALFEQVRPFVFTNVASAKGLDNPIGPQTAWIASWFDYDADGDLDLLLGLDFWGVELFRNDGGAFTRVTTEALPPAQDRSPGAAPNNPMGVTWGDYDNDGCIDVFITGTNLTGQGGFEADVLGDLASRLYRNNCDGTFSDVTTASGFRPTGVTEWSANFVDFDNDGDLDLAVVAGHASEYTGFRSSWRELGRTIIAFVVTVVRGAVLALVPDPAAAAEWAYRYEVMIPSMGSVGLAAAMPNFLYQNQLVETGRPVFVNVNHLLHPRDLGSTLGSAWADFDGDGKLDWFVPNRGRPNRLYRNTGPAGNYLRVRLIGSPLRDAVGAWVRIRVGGVSQIRAVHIRDGYLSQSQLDPHFGLGASDTVDEVWVRWPGSTTWDLRCTAVRANQTITVTRTGAGCR